MAASIPSASQKLAATTKEQGLPIQDLLDDKPSLRGRLDRQILRAYHLARLVPVKEINLGEATLPSTFNLD